MCGICGTLALDGGAADDRAVRAMAGALAHRGPDSEGVFVDRARRRWPRGGWRSSTSRAATSRCATRTARSPSSRTASSTSTAGCRTTWRGAGTGSRRTATRRCCRTSTRSAALDFADRAARHVRDRAVGRARARRLRARPRSVRDQAALLPASRAACCRSRRSSRRSCASRGSRARSTSRRSRRTSRSTASRRRCRSTATCASCRPGTCSWRRTAAVEVRRFARPAPVAAGGRAARGRPGARGRAARAAARLGARAPRVRRAGRRLPVRRHRLVAARGARRAGEPGRGADVLDRLRGAVVRRALAGADGGVALRDRPPRARAPPRRRRAAARDRGGVRRAVRGLVGAADLRGLAAGRRST